MNNLLKIAGHGGLLIWPFLLMGAVFFAASAARPSLGAYGTLLLLFFYPAAVCAIFLAEGWSVFFVSPKWALILTAVAGIIAALAFNIPNNVLSLLQGTPLGGVTLRGRDVVIAGRKIAEADPATFAIAIRMGASDSDLFFMKDKDHVFDRAGRTFEGADPKSFRRVPGADLYVRDDHAVYFAPTAKRLVGANPKAFTSVDANYGVDDVHAYYGDSPIKDADARSFRTDGTAFPIARDARHVFHEGSLVLGADPKSFEAVDADQSSWRDAKSVYVQTNMAPLARLPGADPKTFHALDGDYFADAVHVYYLHPNLPAVTLDGAVSKSFLVQDGSDPVSDARDRTHFYDRGRIVR